MKRFTLLVILLITSCTSPTGMGFSFLEVPFNTISQDHARICVLRGAQMTYSALRDAPIEIDGQLVGGVSRGTFFWADVKPGNREIATRLNDIAGAYRIRASFKAGQHYFIEVLPRFTNPAWHLVAADAGWTTPVLVEALGLFRLNPLPESAAREKLKPLKFIR